MTTASTPVPDYARPTTPGPGLRLHRMPLVWAAVLIPAGFVFFLFFLTPSL
jgi:hypothetical protein